MANVVDFQAVDNLKGMVILLSVFDDILIGEGREMGKMSFFRCTHGNTD